MRPGTEVTWLGSRTLAGEEVRAGVGGGGVLAAVHLLWKGDPADGEARPKQVTAELERKRKTRRRVRRESPRRRAPVAFRIGRNADATGPGGTVKVARV